MQPTQRLDDYTVPPREEPPTGAGSEAREPPRMSAEPAPSYAEERPVSRGGDSMSKVLWWVILAGGIALIGEIIYRAVMPLPDLHLPPAAKEEVAQRAAPAAPAPQQEKPVTDEAPVHYPVEPVADEKPLPSLDRSDGALRGALNDLVPERALLDMVRPNEFVRHIAVTVDNVPRSKMAQRLMPVNPAPGQFAVTGRSGQYEIAPSNAARYARMMRLVNAIDSDKAVAVYRRFYPLFQRAYVDLGYPKSYFNDRLIAAIDHLLATPEVTGPVRLVRPKVLYEFADPQLEALSAGQKALIRTGSANEARIKAKLRELRSALVQTSAARP